MRLGTGGEDGMKRRGEKGKLSVWRRQHQEKNNWMSEWSSKDVCDDGPGINTFEARLFDVVVYPHVNKCIAKGKASFGPARAPNSRRSPLRKPLAAFSHAVLTSLVRDMHTNHPLLQSCVATLL